MATQRKIFGRIPTYRGDWSEGVPVKEKFRFTYRGSEFQALRDGLTAPPLNENDELNDGWQTISNGTEAYRAGEFLDRYLNDSSDNPEFIRVYTDNDGRILWGISPDGNIHFGVGVPLQVAEYITKAIEALDISSIRESVDALEDLGMSVIVDQWLKLIVDAEGHIIESLDEDGTYSHHTRHIFDEVSGTFTGMSFKNTSETTIEDNPEYLDILTDAEGHIIEYILLDGTRYIAKLDSPSISALLTKIEEVRSDLQTQINALSKQKTIICWGDSLTAGAGSANITNVQPVIDTLIAMGYEDKWSSRSSINYETMISTLLPNYSVINCGVGGESTYTIAARQGAEPAFLPNEITIPASKNEQATIIEGTNVALGSLHKRDARVTPLIQGEGNSVNPVYIEGIECTLKAVVANYQVSRYYLQRTKDGNRTVTIPAGTPIIMSGSKKYRNADCAILWCWQNGGYTDNDDLVVQLKNMISHLPTEKYLIIGLHSGTAASRGVQEQLLEQTFGDKFFNWRRYVSTNALYDWGFTPTAEDESAMAVGSIPPTFLTDAVHLKASGYMILGYKMWERMTQLGYFN